MCTLVLLMTRLKPARKKKDGEVKLYTFPDKLSFKCINKIARKMRPETNYALALHVGER